MEIKVLGSGCSKCHSTIGIIERVASDLGVEVKIVKLENPDDIHRHGVHATPAVVIDVKVVHAGGLPSHAEVQGWLKPTPIGFLSHPTRHLFFTGKGGVGKTSLSTAAALTLADAGKKVLLVSTDAASNLDEMLGVELRNIPTPVPGAPGLSVLNIDPDNTAESYRRRVVAQMGASATAAELSTVREQLSGACTTEIASFDEFASLLSDDAEHLDHIAFNTAPTGHTQRPGQAPVHAAVADGAADRIQRALETRQFLQGRQTMKNPLSLRCAFMALSLSLATLPAWADDDCVAPVERWQSREAVRLMAVRQGWQIQRLKIDDGCYELRGTDAQGRSFEAKIDPETLKVLKMKQKDHKGKSEH